VVLNGRAIAELIFQDLASKVKSYQSQIQAKNSSQKLRYPCLAIVQIGNNEASNIYINRKKKVCEKIGFRSIIKKFEKSVSYDEALLAIRNFNQDQEVDGIIIQLPIEEHLKDLILEIDPEKDVDALGWRQSANLILKKDGFRPCTPSGVIRLLKSYNIPIAGANVAIVGRSNLVGRPLALMMLDEDASVFIFHSKSKNYADFLKQADIVVLATGVCKFFNKDMFKNNCVIIDVGISRFDGYVCGDLDSSGCNFYSPVPGGVGPMTVAILMENVFKSFSAKFQIES
jgi:methylenetetrahydrofolate dehydrogenase (NADP+)/methenyltetrahydrofolate cyclohydrolase